MNSIFKNEDLVDPSWTKKKINEHRHLHNMFIGLIISAFFIIIKMSIEVARKIFRMLDLVKTYFC